MAPLLQKISDAGAGRPFLVLVERGTSWGQLAAQLSSKLAGRARVLCVESELVRAQNWSALSDAILQLAQENSLRQFSVIALGAASVLAQNIMLLDLRTVRSAVLVNPTLRPHPTKFTRFVDRLERYLPLGLPLRSRGEAYDGKSLLQRMRCPVLLVSTAGASPFERGQTVIMAERMPTAWHVEILEPDFTSALVNVVMDFQGTAARCPQRANG